VCESRVCEFVFVYLIVLFISEIGCVCLCCLSAYVSECICSYV